MPRTAWTFIDRIRTGSHALGKIIGRNVLFYFILLLDYSNIWASLKYKTKLTAQTNDLTFKTLLFTPLENQAEKYGSLICSKRKTLYHD